MGTIKDIIDLAKDLESRAKDRRDIDTLRQIHSLAFSLQSEHAQVVDRDAKLMSENLQLKQENFELKQQLSQSGAADTCPFCRRSAGQLIKMEPHPVFKQMGVKTGYYKCSNCGKEYDKEIQP